MADYAIYFSPTHGTRACVRMVAGELGSPVREMDLTLPAARREEHRFSADDRVILGVPVYCGRIPQLPGLLDSLRGGGTPVLLIAAYGNRAYEDALLELSVKCSERGFRVRGAITMPAPHCYVPEEVCPDRPDEKDRQALAAFLRSFDWTSGQKVPLPGNTPWKPYPALPFYPEGDSRCTKCGICGSVCPTGAAKFGKTDPETCIRCMACVRSCPVQARKITHPAFAAVQEKLRALAGVRKEIELFVPEERGA